ncbi:MAG: response regulator transcription factor [Actinomycetota bacterium]|nr:response regulator transcription factor [Actinomycetota bacterium]
MDARPPDPIRVVLVEDHELYRAGLKEMLEEEGMRVVGGAASGEDGVALVARAEPDVVLMDVHMGGMSGIEATERVLAASPDARVIMLTVSTDSADVLDALLAGASGYLPKGSSLEEVVSAIRTVMSGRSLLSPVVTRQVIERLRDHARQEAPAAVPPSVLSERERDVLRLLGEGLDNQQIAERLHLGITTVKHHVSNLLEKLGLENRVQAAVYAVRQDIV